MSSFYEVLFRFYIYVYFNSNRDRKKVCILTIRDTFSDMSQLGDLQFRLNGYLADVRGMNNHIVNSDIKGEAVITLKNED